MSTQTAPSASTDPRPAPTGLADYRNWLWIMLFAVMVGSWFVPVVGLAVPFCFVGALISAPIAGRKWCGLYCPRGSFLDRILAKASPRKPVPGWAKHPATRAGMVLFLMSMLAFRMTQVWGDWAAVGGIFSMLLTVTTLVSIVLGVTSHQRTWCSICPAGTLASWMSRHPKPRLAMVNDKCKSCALCSKMCPVNLEPYKIAQTGGTTQADCTKCGTCVAACPVKSLELVRDPRKAAGEQEAEAA